jgi:glycosyltransferase involved in cell wall biosynthesis
MKVLIIIPAYNEERNLARLLDRLKQVCPEYDVVVVNDCSNDGTLGLCRSYGVNTIDLPVNLGIGGAMQAGYKYAFYKDYDAAVQVDGDGQHDPKFISLLLDEIGKGGSICIGSRFINREGFQSSTARRIGIRFFSRLIYLFTGTRVTDPTSGFRACDRKAVALFSREYPRDYPEPETIVNATRRGLTITEVPVVMSHREEGKSSITAIKSFYYMVKVSLAIIIVSFYKHEDREGWKE